MGKERFCFEGDKNNRTDAVATQTHNAATRAAPAACPCFPERRSRPSPCQPPSLCPSWGRGHVRGPEGNRSLALRAAQASCLRQDAGEAPVLGTVFPLCVFITELHRLKLQLQRLSGNRISFASMGVKVENTPQRKYARPRPSGASAAPRCAPLPRIPARSPLFQMRKPRRRSRGQ